MDHQYKNLTIPAHTQFADINFVGCDFSHSIMDDVIFKNVNFYQCIFQKTSCSSARFWGCFFDECTFKNTDLRHTYLGAWGGGLSNCQFIKCKINPLFNTSYLIDCIFDHCKFKTVEIQSLYLNNVKFMGPLEDISIQKLDIAELTQYQTPEQAALIKKKIQEKMANAFYHPDIVIDGLDFSEARLKFIQIKSSTLKGVQVANDPYHLLILKNAKNITQQVYQDIQLNWDEPETQSWALQCIQRFLKSDFAIICFDEFKHFENSDFAKKLMTLFNKYQP